MSEIINKVNLQKGKKIYFASDFHFGIPDYEITRNREIKVCKWLDEIKKDAQQIYLLGDIYDSWMEYKTVVPKGTIRFLGKLAELADAGIEIIIFTGNHDLWMHGYFEKELNCKVYKTLQTIQINDIIIRLGHGDGICKQDKKYLILKSILQHPVSQTIYRQLHPDVGLKLADWFSRLGPKHKYEELKMKNNDEEYQIMYANNVIKTEKIDYFIFGHRHIPISLQLNDNSTFINLGDWINFSTYAIFDGKTASLQKY